MKKRFMVGLLCGISVLGCAVGASAGRINFEDLRLAEPDWSTGLDGSNYHGLTWGGSHGPSIPYSWVVSDERKAFFFPDMGDLTRSGKNYAWNNAGTDLYISSDRNTFDLISLWTRLPHYDNYIPDLKATGFRNNSIVYQKTFELYDTYHLYSMNFYGIDRVTLSASGRNILIDDINYKMKPVPEPATVFAIGTGLVGIAGFARRKKKEEKK